MLHITCFILKDWQNNEVLLYLVPGFKGMSAGKSPGGFDGFITICVSICQMYLLTVSLQSCVYLLHHISMLNALAITFAQLLHTKPSELFVLSTPVPRGNYFTCLSVYVHLFICPYMWRKKCHAHAALLYTHNANRTPSPPVYIYSIYIMRLQLPVFIICLSVLVIPSLLCFALEMVGVSILIQSEASIASNSLQSQTQSLINRRDRGSRLPSSPVLIAAIKSPLTH